jgi:CIC family chloride channel protein
MMSRFRTRVTRTFASRGTTAFLIAAVTLGVFVGLGAAALVLSIGLVQDAVRWSRDTLGITGGWIFVFAVPIGMFTSWALDRRYGPGVAGGGVSETMIGLGLEGGYLSTKLVPTKILATAATIGMGGSGGREGPIVLIGGAIGSSFARYTRFGRDQIRSLVAAGAGAGIGASFNAPIAGMLFAMEVILGSFAIRHLNAVVVVSVTAAVTAQVIVGEERFLSGPAHKLEDPRQLILYTLLALVTVAFGYFFLKALAVTESVHPQHRFRALRPLLAGLVVGLIGVLVPESLGTGQAFLGDLLRLDGPGDFVWWGLFGFALIKAISSALTHASGGSVGSFMPSMVIGGAVGAGFAILATPLWTFSEINVGAFAVVGMAATLAVVARAPLTSIILVFEITGDYALVLPLMLAASLATLLADRIHPNNAYTQSLDEQGIHLPQHEDIDLLDTVFVDDVMSGVDEPATPSMSVAELVELLERGHHHGVPVTDEGRLVGVVSLSDVEAVEGPLSQTTVAEAMSSRPITITPEQPVSEALARMASLGLGRIPVVADGDPGKLLGMFRRESVVKAYHYALGTATGRNLYRERVKLRTQPGAAFFDITPMRRSPVADEQVKNIPWPTGATLVSIRRGSMVHIPHGTTYIETGDTLTFFGTGEAREELAYLVEPVGEATGEQPIISTDH